MTNGRKGDLLHYHFSADEMYILPILVCQLRKKVCLGATTTKNFFFSRADRGLHTALFPDVLDHLVGCYIATETTTARYIQTLHALGFHPCERDR